MDRVTLPTKNDKVGAVMVVGGGIAGIQASLDLADRVILSMWLRRLLALVESWLS